jgi:ribonuclease P protein component
MLNRFKFNKEERLCSHTLLEKLFEEGVSFFSFPFRVLFIKAGKLDGYPVQVVFTVPKRNIKSAVKRNLIRRRMREAYRLNKHILYENFIDRDEQLALTFIFTGKQPADYKVIEKGMLKAIRKLCSVS